MRHISLAPLPIFSRLVYHHSSLEKQGNRQEGNTKNLPTSLPTDFADFDGFGWM